MKKYFIFIYSLLFVVFLFSCNKEKKVDYNELTKVTLRQEWFPYCGYAGEIYASYETAKKYGLNLIVEQGADNIDPIKLVLGGSNDFGVASADRIITANEAGAKLVVIGVVNYQSPTVYISKKNKNIKDPNDWIGKKIGILTGTNTEYIYYAILKKLNISANKLKSIEIPFDLGTFVADQYDVRPAFIYDEPTSLDLEGISYDIVEPKNYGINFLGTVYFTTQKLINDKPDLVQKFINSIADGWSDALKNPDKAIQYLKEYDSNIDFNREVIALKKAIPYFIGENGKILYASKNLWIETFENLKAIGKVKSFDYEQSINNSFINNYFKQKKKKNENLSIKGSE